VSTATFRMTPESKPKSLFISYIKQDRTGLWQDLIWDFISPVVCAFSFLL
jgi:hypothetical protein